MDFALFLLIFLAFYTSGQLLTKRLLGLKFSDSVEAFLFSTAVGSIFFSALATALVFAGWINSAVCWSILGAFLLIGWKNLLHLKTALNIFQGATAQGHAELKNLAQSFLVLLAFLSIGLAMAPAFATDALVHHLAVPKAFLQAGGLVNLPDNIYSFFPQQIEMLYLFALAIGSDSLAQLIGLGIVFLLLLALWHYSSKKVEVSYAWLTPLIFFSTPTFFSLASSAYVELQAATYIFLGFYCWENGCKRKQSSWFILMTLFAGAAVTTKLTSIIILPLALIGLAIHGRSHKNVSQTAIQCLTLALVTLLIISPWLVRNYFFTGNPLAPFFMNIFGGESGMNWDVTRSQMQLKYYSSFGMGHGHSRFFISTHQSHIFQRAKFSQIRWQNWNSVFITITSTFRVRPEKSPCNYCVLSITSILVSANAKHKASSARTCFSFLFNDFRTGTGFYKIQKWKNRKIFFNSYFSSRYFTQYICHN